MPIGCYGQAIGRADHYRKQREGKRAYNGEANFKWRGFSMALKKCKECGGKVSPNAKSCPTCGEPLKSEGMGCGSGCGTFLILGGIFFLWLFVSDFSDPVKEEPAMLQNLKKDPATQARRKKLIDDLVGQGIFYKVAIPGEMPRVYVGNAFYNLPYADKNSFISVVFSYYYSQSKDMDWVFVYDNFSGKEVGAYSPTIHAGLKME